MSPDHKQQVIQELQKMEFYVGTKIYDFDEFHHIIIDNIFKYLLFYFYGQWRIQSVILGRKEILEISFTRKRTF